MRQFSMNKNEKRSRKFREKMINKGGKMGGGEEWFHSITISLWFSDYANWVCIAATNTVRTPYIVQFSNIVVSILKSLLRWNACNYDIIFEKTGEKSLYFPLVKIGKKFVDNGSKQQSKVLYAKINGVWILLIVVTVGWFVGCWVFWYERGICSRCRCRCHCIAQIGLLFESFLHGYLFI